MIRSSYSSPTGSRPSCNGARALHSTSHTRVRTTDHSAHPTIAAHPPRSAQKAPRFLEISGDYRRKLPRFSLKITDMQGTNSKLQFLNRQYLFVYLEEVPIFAVSKQKDKARKPTIVEHRLKNIIICNPSSTHKLLNSRFRHSITDLSKK